MKTFEEWLFENHLETIDEINRFKGAAGLAGMSALAFSSLFQQAAQAATPEAPQGKPAATATLSTTLDQRLQVTYPKIGGGRTDKYGESDQSKFTTSDLINLARDKSGTLAMARQIAQTRLSREHGINLDGHGFATLTDSQGVTKIKVHPVLKIEKGFVNVRTQDGTDARLPLTWLSPESQQLVTRIAGASK